MNALKHGERGTDARDAQRQLRAMLLMMKEKDRWEAGTLDGIAAARVWRERIASELNAF